MGLIREAVSGCLFGVSISVGVVVLPEAGLTEDIICLVDGFEHGLVPLCLIGVILLGQEVKFLLDLS